ncbi:MAG: ATP phosphoribosyltransferase regulatory subunit [Clostridia bacterium]|nr:ATP phosphoribosyltransferase regulatory subunit [Clostridia bacterium]
MESEISILKKSELAELKLRRLYEQYGYQKYRMNQFEEYAFYIENKNFLGCDSFITFNDKDGHLMALKPDVTLSMVKNTSADMTGSKKLYYSENIFRFIKNAGEYRELNQTGLEYIGKMDICSTAEIVTLAAKSLEIIDKSYVLAISHMGMISGLLDEIENNYAAKQKILDCISEKNPHDIQKVGKEFGISEYILARVQKLISVNCGLKEAADILGELVCNKATEEAANEIKAISEILDGSAYAENIRVDFSTVSDTQYYNGILFSGYIEGVASAVVVGGRYDNLLQKMNKGNLQAMGFAVNFYELDRFLKEKSNDGASGVVAVRYSSKCDMKNVYSMTEKLIGEGKKVISCTELPENTVFEEIIDLYKAEEESK